MFFPIACDISMAKLTGPPVVRRWPPGPTHRALRIGRRPALRGRLNVIVTGTNKDIAVLHSSKRTVTGVCHWDLGSRTIRPALDAAVPPCELPSTSPAFAAQARDWLSARETPARA